MDGGRNCYSDEHYLPTFFYVSGYYYYYYYVELGKRENAAIEKRLWEPRLSILYYVYVHIYGNVQWACPNYGYFIFQFGSVISLLHFQMLDSSGIANWSVTHVDWSEGKWHPKSYTSRDITYELMKNITVWPALPYLFILITCIEFPFLHLFVSWKFLLLYLWNCL